MAMKDDGFHCISKFPLYQEAYVVNESFLPGLAAPILCQHSISRADLIAFRRMLTSGSATAPHHNLDRQSAGDEVAVDNEYTGADSVRLRARNHTARMSSGRVL